MEHINDDMLKCFEVYNKYKNDIGKIYDELKIDAYTDNVYVWDNKIFTANNITRYISHELMYDEGANINLESNIIEKDGYLFMVICYGYYDKWVIAMAPKSIEDASTYDTEKSIKYSEEIEKFVKKKEGAK